MSEHRWQHIAKGRWWLTCFSTWSAGGHSSGRFWKRCLSKARRAEWRQRVRGSPHPRTSIRYEIECDMKNW